MISLDIKGAFDHLQYTSIKNSLDNLKYHSNTLETLIDILSNRKVAINTSQDPATWNQQQGYPQGFCTGPAFWNLVADEVPRAPRGAPASICSQAEMLALKTAIEWANTTNEEVNIWSVSESSLQALKSFYVKIKIIQEAQMTLLGNARIRHGCVKALVGIKEATTDGIPASLPSFPKKLPKEPTTTALPLALAS
ncbi:hypothetical protein AVEN_62001-1 [Araneus ventricosus]|uniref:Reverse transcriptase domain-containing protein n=1 Tax=Araneus ventricosus TaxID=182803 RepID=A0A4Y2EAT1_ARAVE|nr:hypothetical protein AVEN_62001-1 [Araneus ventricosus]